MLEEGDHGQLAGQGTAQLLPDPHHLERVAAEIEEIVGTPDPIETQYITPNLRDPMLQLAGGGHIGRFQLRAVPLG